MTVESPSTLVPEPEQDIAGAASGLLPEEEMRADMYDLLAALLARPPSGELLAGLADLKGDETALGQSVNMLSRLAAGASPASVQREFNALFIGVGRGEVLPFASYYMAGFLNEQPLSNLRSDMARLRILRSDNVSEPEDNLASLCDMMAGLIRGRFGDPLPLSRQKTFFNTHIGPWAAHCFGDMEKAKAAVLYGAVGRIGREFMVIETEMLRMVE